MNRRQLAIGLSTAFVTRRTLRVFATDVTMEESPLMRMFRTMPDCAAADGQGFQVTAAVNHTLQRQVWPENPDMYWDPTGEDFKTIFGFRPVARMLSGAQDGVALWTLDTNVYVKADTLATLTDNGWSVVDADWPLLQYTADDDAREAFGESLNILGSEIYSGTWDWIALPDDSTLVLGSDEELVRMIATEVNAPTALPTVESNFHQLAWVLPVEAYVAVLVPGDMLGVPRCEAGFVSKSWRGDEPIVQSLGLRMEHADAVDTTVSEIDGRLASESSPFREEPYADFLERGDTLVKNAALRMDFTVTNGEWDIVQALASNDLRMLPTS